MAEKTQAELEAEKQANGGETIDKETTGKTPEQLAELATKNAKIAEDQRGRAEKAERALKEKTDAEEAAAAEAKKKADAAEAEKNKNNNTQQADPLEVAKLANVLQGLSEAEVTNLTIVAKAKGVSLAEAKKDPLFTSWQTQFLEEQKKKDAKLGGNRGSSESEPDEDTKGLVPDIHQPLDKQREEHMAATKKLMGKR